ILPSGNQVIYTNCFTDFDADILVTYRKNGFECDLIFRQKPPVPEIFDGLNAATCRLQLLTEFLNTDEPVAKAAPASRADGLADSELTFVALKMTRGKAF